LLPKLGVLLRRQAWGVSDDAASRLKALLWISLHLILHTKCGVQSALRMVLVGDRRTEERENAIAGRLHHIAVVARTASLTSLNAASMIARFFGVRSSIGSIEPLMSRTAP
jgi:hypothetical protein